ncbi:alpha/beta hydrolase [Pyxidicoccus fallax]|uniref:Alpha/beta hydrolase n=1 Tax=Pyxidicoccus fallax TaxID=394095 RepID=A0A848L6R0_9BACT|nr:alpha/beta hydrolase [Pyxidicoccus fallax]NMO14207.1 alpha/beta hydrolase [Pyxidicoccus fallax]NPC82208.1 alpha/beta hydrolase [Pyxidicoccus fallax]
MSSSRLFGVLVFLWMAAVPAGASAAPPSREEARVPGVRYRTVKVEGLDIFYREAGPSDAPVLLLLHGFPTSSHMFRDLIPALADRYRVIAPDYPGFGQSSMPERGAFAYTFDNLARVMEGFTEAVGVKRYALYVMDYGAPVGYRLATRHPERVSALIVQNGNAYDEGLGEFWAPLRKYWSQPTQENRDALRSLLTLEATKWQYTHGVPDTSRVSPDAWTVDQALLDRPGNADIQLDLFYDYRTNLPLYPVWQAYFRKYQPPTLVVWGKNDAIFIAPGAAPYQRDLPTATVHLLDAGHFALESSGPRITALIREFLAKHRGELERAPRQ